MRILEFYRFYIACFVGGGVYFFLLRSLWIWFIVTISFRILWFIVEMIIEKISMNRAFQAHIDVFRQLYGPYGIRIANKAETNSRIKKSLYEVFTPNYKKLAKNVEQLEVLDALYNAGMRPEGDEFLLHDLKLKYGRHRLVAEKKK